MPSLEELEARAAALARTGESGEEAIRVNTAILAMDDMHCAAYNRLGRCYMELGRYEAARDVYRQVLALSREGESAHRVAENRLRSLKDLLGAESARREVRSIPTYEEAMAAGLAARAEKDLATALAAFERAFELQPTAAPLNALAATYRDTGHLDIAESTYKRALSLEDNRFSWVGLAAVYRDKRQFEEAEHRLLAAIAQHPNGAVAWRGLAGVYGDMEQTEKAKACWQRANELGGIPWYGESHS